MLANVVVLSVSQLKLYHILLLLFQNKKCLISLSKYLIVIGWNVSIKTCYNF